MVEAMDFEAILSNWYNKSVKLIFEKQTLSIPDDSKKSTERNRDIIKDFSIQFFWDMEFDKYFGFSEETWEAEKGKGIWPAAFCLTPLIRKMALKAPRLFFKKTADGKVEEMPICYALLRHFELERVKRRDLHGLPPKQAAKKGIYTPQNF